MEESYCRPDRRHRIWEQEMKTGDLVRMSRDTVEISEEEKSWSGIIVDWEGINPIVLWNENFQQELEYHCQLEGISESR